MSQRNVSKSSSNTTGHKILTFVLTTLLAGTVLGGLLNPDTFLAASAAQEAGTEESSVTMYPYQGEQIRIVRLED